MLDIGVSLVFLAVPILIWWLSRSLAWTVTILIASAAIVGALTQALLTWGAILTFGSLQLLTLVQLLSALGVTIIRYRGRSRTSSVDIGYQFRAVLTPVAVAVSFFILARLLAAPAGGVFAGVGFLMKRVHAEDNAKWLDFTSQLATGQGIEQAVILGGPLQLFLVPVATVFAALSTIFYGGVNQVLVSVNTVVWAEFLLAAMAGLVLAPVVERRWFAAGRRRRLPSVTVWAGSVVVITGSLAASGLGHLTLQYSLLVAGLWAATFLAPAKHGELRWLASLALVGVFLVWFPLLAISGPVLIAGLAVLLVRVVRHRTRRVVWMLLAWLLLAVLVLPEVLSTASYMADISASSPAPSGGGSPRGVAAATVLPQLQLLSSQGGTEVAGPLLSILAVAALIGAGVAVSRELRGRRHLLQFAPLAALVGYGLVLSTFGTWAAGSGPNYGALKVTYMSVVLVATLCLPIALTLLASNSGRLSLSQLLAAGGVLVLLTVDGLLPRAMTYSSPNQWPGPGIWSPAEVRPTGDQPIASVPIGCVYRTDQAGPPTVLIDGQRAYSCTRLLTGLAGADAPAQPLVDWQRREWLTNTPAWLDEYPNLIEMPQWVRTRSLILLDGGNEVSGLETVERFLDQFRPAWAEDQQ